MSTTGTNNTSPRPPRLTAKDAERFWRARDRYHAKSWLITFGLVISILVLTFFLGCAAYTRAVWKLSGFAGDPLPGPTPCAPASLQAGTCLPEGSTR